MAKRKLERFAAIETFSNVYQHFQTDEHVKDFEFKGKWGKEVFKNQNPIVLELGCGKGEYTLGLAKEYTNKNFMGLDLKGNRIWRGAKTAIDENIENAKFLRCRIENIEYLFDRNEVDEIWITFPDPQPQKPRERKRLTSPNFIEKYRKIIKTDATIHLKTDSFPLYEYSLEAIKNIGGVINFSTNDLYAEPILPVFTDTSLKAIQTHYEKLFSQKGHKICYIQFKIN